MLLKPLVMKMLQVPAEISPRPYQEEAIDAWVQAGGQGILSMATGTGKTITALVAAARLKALQDGRMQCVVVAPYAHLVDQWADATRSFKAEPILASGSRHRWTDPLVSALTAYRLGTRDTVVVITTMDTFAGDAFQSVLERFEGHHALLIGDEVHHMGRSSVRRVLPDRVRARLGLSATPRRFHDEAGTDGLLDYFASGIVFEYGIDRAIDAGYLTPYHYVPHIIELTDEEADRYVRISRKLGRRIAAGADLDDEGVDHLLFRRARLIAAAAGKLAVLRQLLEARDDQRHSLVYCGDGRTDTEEGEGDRQIDAVTRMVGRELDIDTHRFTYTEDQAERRRLLSGFDAGDIEVLVAIRCLDEGVDVPATRTAYILASTTNPRQFIQRRGRILRRHPGKRTALIHDFVVRPPAGRLRSVDDDLFNLERTMVQREVRRVRTFERSALNHPDAPPQGVQTTPGSITQLQTEFLLHDI
jgi:superfamily II DNA or RNA helicase